MSFTGPTRDVIRAKLARPAPDPRVLNAWMRRSGGGLSGERGIVNHRRIAQLIAPAPL